MNKYSLYLDDLIFRSKLSLTEISNRCEESGVKVTVSYLSKLRNGRMPPPSFKISAILAKVLGESPEKLIAISKLVENDYNSNELREALQTVYPDLDNNDIANKEILVSEFYREETFKELDNEIALDPATKYLTNDDKAKLAKEAQHLLEVLEGMPEEERKRIIDKALAYAEGLSDSRNE